VFEPVQALAEFGATVFRLDHFDERNVLHQGTSVLEQLGQSARSLARQEYPASQKRTRHRRAS
jgi:hypothetical protein